MLAGHFGLAAVVKSRAPQVPLWALMLSTQLLDLVFLALLPFGLESFRVIEGRRGGYGELIFTADYSHSLVGALGISLAAAIIAWIAWGMRSGLTIGAVAFSHWLLDLLVHHPDLPVMPGGADGFPRLGFGLWNLPYLTFAIELVLVLLGSFLYYHAAMRQAIRAERQEAKSSGGGVLAAAAAAPSRAHRQSARIASIAMVVFLLLTLITNALGY